MVFESSLSQTATQFSDSLSVKPVATVEQTTEEISQEAKTPEQEQSGDTVSISEEARALVAAEKSGGTEETESESDEETEQEQLVDRLEKQIEALEQELEEIDDSDLPEKQKLQQKQAKEAQLMELRDQLLQAQQEVLESEGLTSGGGTSATGFGNSASSF
ncbi:FlxA-like family protein [Pseudodesulfovibrio piezophilus]|uniref:Uncharacterized protein n=1 Tax=Pseudodesulfovibrio piezophilus (strain DSM 21447 / JCM 15486 / C1TLV30) TaxID=1322246 RepID=M1WXA0_PSEP2|nr:FlxA-like family protein [Pseudodesulfovibrio piezophilus]CCH49618.1 conserved protein of unknown function [Pseudodesulfovibrio piezophilus C1TLV30]